jgi:coenzyme F420 hydrogenase subunit alpha
LGCGGSPSPFNTIIPDCTQTLVCTAMSRIVGISPTTRNEGHSKLVLKIDDNGLVERGDWVAITPVRGFEKLSIGKSMHQVPKIASRICGICPVAHVLAGVGAMEASIGCEIPDDARTLRMIIHCASRLSVHALHGLMVLPDFFLPGTGTRINPYSPEARVRKIALRIQRLRQIGQEIVQIAGGEAIHPSNPRVGGMYRNVSPHAKTRMYDLAKEGIPLAREHAECMIAIFRDFQRREWVEIGGTQVPVPRNLGYHSQGYLATDALYGTSSLDADPSWDPSRYSEVRPWAWYGVGGEVTFEDPAYPGGGTTPAGTIEDPQRESCQPVPLYDGQPVEVGAAARLTRFRNFGEKGTIGQLVARQMEYLQALYELIDCIDRLDPAGKVVADSIPNGEGKTGWAVNEAPRGSLVHIARVRNRKVEHFSMAVPTAWNMPVAGMALTGAPWQLAEVIIRGYDPCLSCATHMIVVDADHRIVAERTLA